MEHPRSIIRLKFSFLTLHDFWNPLVIYGILTGVTSKCLSPAPCVDILLNVVVPSILCFFCLFLLMTPCVFLSSMEWDVGGWEYPLVKPCSFPHRLLTPFSFFILHCFLQFQTDSSAQSLRTLCMQAAGS